MTHEQKPESAEFRTREEQYLSLGAALSGEVGDEKVVKHWHSYALRHILEAEARGAAEQRREDAEVKSPKPSAYIHTMYYRGEGGNKPDKRLSFSPDKDAVFGKKGVDYDPLYVVRVKPLYTRPANVAALEARVKELEGEVERLKTPEWYISQEEGDEADSIAGLMECHDPWEIVEIDGYRSVKKVWVFTDAEGDTHQFGTKEDARSAIAAIREGGEHV